MVDSPEVLSIIDSLAGVQQLLEALYHCKYHQFFAVGDHKRWNGNGTYCLKQVLKQTEDVDLYREVP